VYRARRQPKCAKERRCIKRHRNNSDPLFVFLRNSFHTKTARPRPWPGLLALSLAACPAEAPRLAQMPCTPAAPRRTLRAERRCTLVDAASTLQTTPGLPTRSTRPGSSCFVDHVHDLRLLLTAASRAGRRSLVAHRVAVGGMVGGCPLMHVSFCSASTELQWSGARSGQGTLGPNRFRQALSAKLSTSRSNWCTMGDRRPSASWMRPCASRLSRSKASAC
jgi:hypothetical protein